LLQWPGYYYTREDTSSKTAAVNIYKRIGDGRTPKSTDTPKRQNNNSPSKCEVETIKPYKGILLQVIAMIVAKIVNEQYVDNGVGLLTITDNA
jgi:hypothetical protein